MFSSNHVHILNMYVLNWCGAGLESNWEKGRGCERNGGSGTQFKLQMATVADQEVCLLDRESISAA